jgi:cytochrome c-type biogenesis protein CcmH
MKAVFERPNRWPGALSPGLHRNEVVEQRPPSAAASRVRRIAATLALIATIILFMGAGDTLEQRFNNLGNEKLMCACGCAEMLLKCNHVGCSYSDRMRQELMATLKRGDNDSMVLQWFVQKYGPTVLAAPTDTGFNRVAWIVPFLALGGGILLTIALVRAWKHRAAVPAVAAPAGLSPAAVDTLRRRVHEETEI